MTQRRKYAQDTTVAVTKSRGQIENLLDDFGATDWAWACSRREAKATLQFIWEDSSIEPPARYMARFSIPLPSEEKLRVEAHHERTGKFLESKYEKLRTAAGQREHRALYLWLKACLVGIEEGIITPEEVFLPFLVTPRGTTVAEEARKNLPNAVSNVAGLLVGRIEP